MGTAQQRCCDITHPHRARSGPVPSQGAPGKAVAQAAAGQPGRGPREGGAHRAAPPRPPTSRSGLPCRGGGGAQDIVMLPGAQPGWMRREREPWPAPSREGAGQAWPRFCTPLPPPPQLLRRGTRPGAQGGEAAAAAGTRPQCRGLRRLSLRRAQPRPLAGSVFVAPVMVKSVVSLRGVRALPDG